MKETERRLMAASVVSWLGFPAQALGLLSVRTAVRYDPPPSEGRRRARAGHPYNWMDTWHSCNRLCML